MSAQWEFDLTREGTYTGLAVLDGAIYSSLCPELDIASMGATPAEALDNLADAVRESISVARDHGLQPGQPAPSDAIREFCTTGDTLWGRYPLLVEMPEVKP